MLDIGFSELMVIGVVALVVLGPERLPRVARTAGHLLGRFQRYVSQVKADINREIELAELKNLQASVEDAARSIETSVKTGMDETEKELRSAESELQKTEQELRESVAMPHMGTGAQAWPIQQAAQEAPESVAAPPAVEVAVPPLPEPSPVVTPGASTSPEHSSPPKQS